MDPRLNSLPKEIKEVANSMIKVMNTKYNIDAKIINNLIIKILSVEYIIYSSVSEIQPEYLVKTNKIELVLSYGLVQMKVKKINGVYKPQVVCFINKHLNNKLMYITIIHELLHIMSIKLEIDVIYERVLLIKQGFIENIYTLDKNDELITNKSNKDQNYINEAYTQYFAREIYECIYKETFAKLEDVYYVRTMCIAVHDIINSKKILYDALDAYIKADVSYYNRQFYLPVVYVNKMKTLDSLYSMKNKKIKKGKKRL